MLSTSLQRARSSRLVNTWLVAIGLLTASTATADRPVAGSVTTERLKVPSGPSSVRGLADEPAVDPYYAQLDYQIPIEVPSGLGGLAPALGLAYSGALGNGPLGIGWTLGETRIQRSTRLGVPRFDDADTLEISGVASGRLVAIGGGAYRVEGKGQTVRVRRVGDGFEVDDGGGVRYRMGVTASGRHERDATHTLAWRLEEATNQMGERVRYEYIRDQGQMYLSRVIWGPGDVYRAELSYQPRSDATTSFREGFRVVTGQRLATIKVVAFEVERRAYHLSYDATFPIARLAAVTSTGMGGAGAWPASTFTYAGPASPAIVPVSGIGNWRLNSSGTTLVDLDGDGAAELLQVSGGGHSYLTNQNGSFSAQQTLTGNAQPISLVQLQDLDGDSRAELVQDTGNGWAVYKFTRTQWVSQAASLPNGVWPGSPGLALKQPSTTRFADLNGDGLIDAVQWDNDNLKIRLATRTGFGASYSVGKIGGLALPTAPGRFQDLNGDGLYDYIVVATDRLDTYLGHGDGTFEPVRAIAYPFAGTVSSPEDVELADLDRDGLNDLIRIELGTVRWFRGKPDGTYATSAVTLANPELLSGAVVVAVTDINGNGSQDVVWSSTSGMWRMDLAGATTAGMLTRAQNGLGMEARFAYQSSHALAVEAALAGSPWGSNVPIAIPVPVEKTTVLGPGETTRKINYGVRDGFWDAGEQRFGGFLTTVVTTWGATPAETSSLTTRYHAGTGVNRVLRGRPLVEQVKDGTGRRLSMTTHTWATIAVAGLPDVPLLRSGVLLEVRTRYEDTTPIRESSVVYEHDALGRVTREVNKGRLDLAGDDSVHDTRYADDDVTWVRDRVCEDKVSDTTGHVLTHAQHFFGDDHAVNALCVVGKGWPRETKAYLDTEGRFVSQTASTYDDHGNVTSVTTGGVTRYMAYDASGLFPIEERVGAPSGNLVWSATWNNVLGAMTTLTDPNDHVTTIGYDSLGRQTTVALDGSLPHVVIAYDLTPPFPKTTTWTFDGAHPVLAAKPDAWSATSEWRQTVEVRNGLGEVRYNAVRLGDTQWIVSDYHEVDANSRVVFAGRPVLSSQLELASRPMGVVGDVLAYDPLGRLIAQTLPTGALRTYSYVAFERTAQDPDLAPVHSVLDGKGRAIMTERSLPDGTHEIVRANYDAAGRLTTMTLSGGTVTRTFTYDSLGRLTQSSDPDLGTRALTWDDGNRLLTETNAAGQTLRYTYDALGRLSTRDTGSLFTFHYDTARPGATGPLENLAGQLAWTEEPTGGADLGYDAFGRATFARRRIDDRVSEATTRFATSGIPLLRSYDDGFSYTHAYDPAARLIGIGDLWNVLQMDAAGGILHERTQNGVVTTYARDVLGLVSRVTVRDVDGLAIYDVSATRNLASEILTETDHDNSGLDHSATFTYDRFARLTGTTIGGGGTPYAFSYSYDALHNMTSRTGPSTVQAMFGTHHYGETGRGPRQLTSITDAGGAITHTFDFDAAGRQIAEDALRLTFDASDRVTRVTGLPAGTVTHAYGVDGQRLKTVAPGSVQYFFGDGTSERNGVREHDIAAGNRVIARVAFPATSAGDGPGGPSGLGAGPLDLGSGGAVACAAVGLALAIALSRSRRRRRAFAALAISILPSCSTPLRGERASAVTVPVPTFMHASFGAGPVVFTDGVARVLEERRYEPFGAPIGTPDLAARDLNPLNKRTDAATGWSDHGARWLAFETARWLTPDPVVAVPDARFMDAPWGLHPYQYVDQNPTRYWDPDGREPRPTTTEILRISNVLGRDRGALYEHRWFDDAFWIAIRGWRVVVSSHEARTHRGSYDALVTYERSATNTIQSMLSMTGGTPLRRLMIADHGNSGRQMLGWETLLDVDSKGKPKVDAALLQLAGKFTRDGVLVLGGCSIMDKDNGQAANALRHLSKLLDVEVRAGTGLKNASRDEIDWETTACRGDRCVTANDEAGIAEAWKK